MTKPKLFLYPNARPHEHDLNPSQVFVNTVPMSRFGISEYFDICDPEEADYFYMGQFKNDPSIQNYSTKNFEFFEGNESKHIFDYEGEGGQEHGSGGEAIPEWLHDSIITANGTLKKYKDLNIYTRPTFTNLLVDIAHNRFDNFIFPEEISMGFTGFLNSEARVSMLNGLADCREDTKINVIINEFWSGPAPLGHPIQEEYILFMLNNLISLCPRGSGIDSVRLYETCYFTRVPVLISDHDYFMVGEDDYDTSFCYRICSETLDPDYIAESLQEIYDEPMSELQNRANDARKYFEEVIRPYFQDPTLRFLEWLEKNER
mgnify:FL=1